MANSVARRIFLLWNKRTSFIAGNVCWVRSNFGDYFWGVCTLKDGRDWRKQSGWKERGRWTTAKRFTLAGGILAFFGLDELSRLERQYEREVDDYKDSEKDGVGRLKDILKLAILNSRKGEHEKAEKLLHIALRMAIDMQHQNAITYIHSLLANLALKTEDYKKAEKLFVDVMQRQLYLRHLPEDDNSILEMSLKLARIFSRTEEREKAEQGFEFCLEKLKGKVDQGIKDEDTLALYGMSLDWYGQFLMNTGRANLARVRFEEAYKISQTLNGENAEQTLIVLNSLATACSTASNLNEADVYFDRVITAARRWNSEHLPSFLANYGWHKIQRQAFREAKSCCLESLGLAKLSGKEEATLQATACLEKLKETSTRK